MRGVEHDTAAFGLMLQRHADDLAPYWILYWLAETAMGREVHRSPYPAPPRDMRYVQRGDRSLDVMWVQWALGVKMINGQFNAGLERRLRRFQVGELHRASGQVDPATRNALRKIDRRSGVA